MAGGISVRRMSADRMPISRGIAPLADIPDREGGDGGPELVIRGENPVIPVPMLPRWRHEIGQAKAIVEDIQEALSDLPKDLQRLKDVVAKTKKLQAKIKA